MTSRRWVLPVAVAAAGSGGAVAVLAGGGVEPGTTDRVAPSVSSTSRGRGTNAVRLRGTLVTVELAPVTP